MNKITNTINRLTDTHIIKSACIKPKKKSVPLRVIIFSAAACLVLALISIPIIDILSHKSLPNGNSTLPTAFPYVVVNEMFYWYADRPTSSTLPEGYELIGEVLSNDIDDRGKSGYSSGCKIGDEIFQNPDFPREVIVHTRLFHGNKYRYTRFSADVFSR